jgi:hypothetical protein
LDTLAEKNRTIEVSAGADIVASHIASLARRLNSGKPRLPEREPEPGR